MQAFADLWRYRQALCNFVVRDLTVRYKRSIFGFLWSFLNPVMLILTFWVLVKVIMGNDEPNYTVKLCCTILAWRFFNQVVMDGAACVGAKLALIKRVNFPRMLLPASSLIANLVDYLLSLAILIILFAVVRVTVNWPYVGLAVLALMIQLILSFGLSLVLSSLSVFFTDVQFLVGNLFQMWFFLTPVIVSASLAAQSTRFGPEVKMLYFLNPMAPLMMAYRSILPGESPAAVLAGTGLPSYYHFLAISAAVSVCVFLLGLAMFRRWEPRFAKEG